MAKEAKPKKLTDYTPDSRNARRGTQRGAYLLETSLQETGSGRSIVVDKHGKVIAGNKTLQAAIDSGYVEVLEIETEGDQIIVHRRKDLDLDDPRGRGRLLAFFDNRTSDMSDFDPNQIVADIAEGVDLTTMFYRDEVEEIVRSVVLDLSDFDERPKSSDKTHVCPNCGHEF